MKKIVSENEQSQSKNKSPKTKEKAERAFVSLSRSLLLSFPFSSSAYVPGHSSEQRQQARFVPSFRLSCIHACINCSCFSCPPSFRRLLVAFLSSFRHDCAAFTRAETHAHSHRVGCNANSNSNSDVFIARHARTHTFIHILVHTILRNETIFSFDLLELS